MLKIQNITADTKQKQTVALPDGTSFTFSIEYKPLQRGWFITELTYNDFTLHGMRICNHPNLLHQFKNILPFGIACFSKDNREPMLQDDFDSGTSELFVLEEEEKQYFTDFLRGTV